MEEVRKIKVVGYPGKDGIEYVALDAATGEYLDGQIDVVIQTSETGVKNAQIVINCGDIVVIGSSGLLRGTTPVSVTVNHSTQQMTVNEDGAIRY
jgi:hypothetical protein